ncbi:hypothetical protein I0C86_28625 [Plantactinospora sp. S1510]|uniref:Secreted protein n=1 Tax=Plantactinospora alkalitolerans TaxID=2789879 RepID=A0ABS0H430_9ACTN|nr:DUF5980 family protein [Plantactinospora alkalitolerans]MBF9132894.1 hypothetical protein [Plantactinospora alkalitolerans]
MLRSTFGVARLALGLVTALTLALIGSQPAAAAGTTTSAATWQLTNIGQRVCIPAGESWFTYFWITIDGTWSTPIEVGARDLPAGTTTSLPHVPIPPGSSDGHIALNLIAMTLPPLPFGVYRPELTASDGTRTQSVPVTIQVQETWGCAWN